MALFHQTRFKIVRNLVCIHNTVEQYRSPARKQYCDDHMLRLTLGIIARIVAWSSCRLKLSPTWHWLYTWVVLTFLKTSQHHSVGPPEGNPFGDFPHKWPVMENIFHAMMASAATLARSQEAASLLPSTMASYLTIGVIEMSNWWLMVYWLRHFWSFKSNLVYNFRSCEITFSSEMLSCFGLIRAIK